MVDLAEPHLGSLSWACRERSGADPNWLSLATFARPSLVEELSFGGEDHGDAALVGRGDCLVVVD